MLSATLEAARKHTNTHTQCQTHRKRRVAIRQVTERKESTRARLGRWLCFAAGFALKRVCVCVHLRAVSHVFLAPSQSDVRHKGARRARERRYLFFVAAGERVETPPPHTLQRHTRTFTAFQRPTKVSLRRKGLASHCRCCCCFIKQQRVCVCVCVPLLRAANSSREVADDLRA